MKLKSRVKKQPFTLFSLLWALLFSANPDKKALFSPDTSQTRVVSLCGKILTARRGVRRRRRDGGLLRRRGGGGGSRYGWCTR